MNGRIIKSALCFLAFSLSAAGTLFADIDRAPLPKELESAQIVEKLGNQVDIENLEFKNETGEPVKLSQFFKKDIPVVVVLAYYSCPSLCGVLLNGVTNSLRAIDWTPGKEFSVVVASINPKESSELARLKKETLVDHMGRVEAAGGMHFLTGQEPQIKALASQLGFGYYYDEAIKEYAHSAGIFVLTPTGKISRVLYGVDFPQKDLKLSLLEASEGKIGNTFERFLMFCYRYDPTRGGYALQAMKLVQAGGLLTILIIGGYLFWFWRRERRKKNEEGRMAA